MAIITETAIQLHISKVVLDIFLNPLFCFCRKFNLSVLWMLMCLLVFPLNKDAVLLKVYGQLDTSHTIKTFYRSSDFTPSFHCLILRSLPPLVSTLCACKIHC